MGKNSSKLQKVSESLDYAYVCMWARMPMCLFVCLTVCLSVCMYVRKKEGNVWVEKWSMNLGLGKEEKLKSEVKSLE